MVKGKSKGTQTAVFALGGPLKTDTPTSGLVKMPCRPIRAFITAKGPFSERKVQIKDWLSTAQLYHIVHGQNLLV